MFSQITGFLMFMTALTLSALSVETFKMPLHLFFTAQLAMEKVLGSVTIADVATEIVEQDKQG
ncbi:hypothetical protein [Aquibacillus salsiterrae]|uniref:Uncharacterized protein n=1 Tax=Aquibacillus salsiterrae TaxID=2950439 RepID=A0A9X4AHH6_9BACI|nr:hypothetical protein [Aquibacillus salsiterrae]MDC3418208.1 hypothetical protein [Aquibacillus salsiterrae]